MAAGSSSSSTLYSIGGEDLEAILNLIDDDEKLWDDFIASGIADEKVRLLAYSYIWIQYRKHS